MSLSISWVYVATQYVTNAQFGAGRPNWGGTPSFDLAHHAIWQAHPYSPLNLKNMASKILIVLITKHTFSSTQVK